MIKREVVAAFLAIMVAFGGHSLAFAQEESESSPLNVDAGLGIAYRSKLYRGDDSNVTPIPMIFYEGERFYFKGKTAGYGLLRDGGLSFDLIAQWRPDGYDASDSRYLSGMSDRDMTIDVGVSASYADGWGMTSVSLVTDILGKHDGQELTLSYGKRFVREQWSFVPSAGAAWQSSNLTDYYYGVRGKEATAERPKYSGHDSISPFVAMQVNCRINEAWSAMAIIRYEWLDSDISDSPIVSKHHDMLVMIGAMYKF
jgi:outer membrane protein